MVIFKKMVFLWHYGIFLKTWHFWTIFLCISDKGGYPKHPKGEGGFSDLFLCVVGVPFIKPGVGV